MGQHKHKRLKAVKKAEPVTVTPSFDADMDEARKRKCMILTPAFGGMWHGPYGRSLIKTMRLFDEYGIECNQFTVENDALVTRARNTCAYVFDNQGYDNAIFIDADIEWTPRDVLELHCRQTDDSPYDIIGVAYPRKSINWTMVRKAALAGVPANQLKYFAGDFVMNFEEGQTAKVTDLMAPLAVPELGTGFMMIRKATFQQMAAAHPEWSYKPDHMSWEEFHKSTLRYWNFFQAPVDPETERLLSEDYFFTQAARKIGLKTYICPWMKLKHVGKHEYEGSLLEQLLLEAKLNAEQRSDEKVREGHAEERVGSESEKPEASRGDHVLGKGK